MFFSSNMKLLRKRRGKTQEELASILGLKRPTLNNYENRVAQPTIDVLISSSAYFNVSIDTLVKVDLEKLSESQLRQLERGFDVYLKGSNLRVLTATVGIDNEENIELVPEKAKAGYLAGFADPEFISRLPVFRLPFLRNDRKYRTFQISGDSMLPIPDGAFVTGEFVQDWTTIRSGEAFVVLTLDDGVAFKVVENRLEESGAFRLISLNTLYKPYDVNASDVKEMWRFVHYISDELPAGKVEREEVLHAIDKLQRDVAFIKGKME